MLAASLESHGAEVIRLVRRAAGSHELAWDPLRTIAPAAVSGYHAVIHLSGENVAGRWNDAKKKRIRDSRVISTQNLAQALVSAERKPAVFVCASAIGYYGSRGDEILTEASPAGEGFLPAVCREWEEATAPTAQAGIRVVNLRIGIVLSRHGGALKQMLLPFRLGLGGRIGSGRQWFSWIHIDDLVAAVQHILSSSMDTEIEERRASLPQTQGRLSPDEVSGPVNLVAPDTVTNAEFTKSLASVLHRPAIVPVPGFAARLAFGELADEGLLASTRVQPSKLMRAGFEFRYPELLPALVHLLK